MQRGATRSHLLPNPGEPTTESTESEPCAPRVGNRSLARYGCRMTIPINAEIHRKGKWYVAFSPEFPEANGQGETQQECIENLKAAILLLLEDRREESRQNLPAGRKLVEIA